MRAVKVAPGDVVQEGDVLVEIVLTSVDWVSRRRSRSFVVARLLNPLQIPARSAQASGSRGGRDSNPR